MLKNLIDMLVLIVLLIVASSPVRSQWLQQSTWAKENVNFYSVSFVNQQHGWIVGAGVGGPGEAFSAVTFRTTDGGTSWDQMPQPTNTKLNDVFMLDTLTGWIVGDKGTILKRYWKPGTVGIQWHPQPSGVIHNLRGAFFLDSQRGWACGTNGIILATTDGGLTWKQQNIEAEPWQAFNDIHFTDAMNGWAVGWVNAKTTNGGANWTDVTLPSSEEMRDVHFTSNQHGVIVGRLGTILHTNNEGSSWQSVWSNTGVMFTGVDFANTLEGWAVGGGVYNGSTWLDSARILHTTDGGLTWSHQSSPVDKWIMDLSVVDRQHAWTVGNSGTIFRYNSPTSVLNEQAQGELEDPNYIDYDLLGRVASVNGQGIRLRYWHGSGRTRLLFSP